jgi:hypothetical protein
VANTRIRTGAATPIQAYVDDHRVPNLNLGITIVRPGPGKRIRSVAESGCVTALVDSALPGTGDATTAPRTGGDMVAEPLARCRTLLNVGAALSLSLYTVTSAASTSMISGSGADTWGRTQE